MIGVVVNGLGANDETAGLGSNNFTECSLPCIIHWFWRVAELQIEFNFTKAADASTISGSFTLAKVFPSTSPAEYVVSDHQLAGIRPGAFTAPFYESVIGAIEVFNAGIFRQRIEPVNIAEKRWRIDHEFRCNQFGSAWGVDEISANPAGTWEMNATDPVTGKVFDISGNLFSTEPDISGSLTITPASFYPWNDRNGNPKYDVTDGTLV